MSIHLADTREWVEEKVMSIIAGVIGEECSRDKIEDHLRLVDSRPALYREICDRIEDEFCLHDLQSRMRKLAFPQLIELIVVEFESEEVKA